MSDYRAFPVLYVDDESQNLVAFRYALEERFCVLTAGSGEAGLELLASQDVAVLVCDQRMPGMSGVEVCSRAREIKPDVARIIVTAYSDLQTAIDAINRGHVFRYLTKPWRNEELTSTLDAAIELVRVRRTLATMQARVLRGAQPPLLEAVLKQVAAELKAPIAELQNSQEQVADLLDAGLQSWTEPNRVQELVQHARQVQRDSQRPLTELRDVVRQLEHGQRLAATQPAETCDAARVARVAVQVAIGALSAQHKLELSAAEASFARIGAAELGQALLHLISQATQAVKGAARPWVRVDVSAADEGVEVAVSDSGPPVRPEDLARVFDPYFGARPGPPGTSLALVKHVVERAGGRVRVESPPAGGARFVLWLPPGDAALNPG